MINEVEVKEKAILIRINKLYHESMTEKELYEATRGVWKVGTRRDAAEYAIAIFEGEVKEVFRINSWLPAGTLPYRSRSKSDVEVEGRWEFNGILAENDIRDFYLGKSLKSYFPKGAANPISYVNC